ncbi:5484_t:CDS:2, partial [Acaulospora morrowiae]
MLPNAQVEDMINITSSSINETITINAATIANVEDDLIVLSRKKEKRITTFQPRTSQLDRETLESHRDPFRGFFTLFWIAMAFYILKIGVWKFKSAGILFDLSFFRLFSHDAIGLILSDAFMVGSMFFVVLLQKLIALGLIRWKYTGM